MFERPQSGERAVLVHIGSPASTIPQELEEFRELTVSAGATPVAEVRGSRRIPDPKYYVGAGKAEEIRAAVETYAADVVLVNHELSPGQQRELERLTGRRVLDRTELILDIFAQRARSFEGKLQVELAQLQHLSTRLVRGWTHLERQKGGIGLRGPGETQLESDRRLIGGRIKQLKKRLHKVREHRVRARQARQKALVNTVSLVGYTNAGKSTLFNRLTGAGVFAADQLFATLDPTMRRLPLGLEKTVVIADTVGFIRQLPHDLVEAFHSTLEETRDADLLLHVIDARAENRNDCAARVNEVLEQIGAGTVPQIQVYNKIDLLGESPRIDRDGHGRVHRVWLSAATGQGLDLLRSALAQYFVSNSVDSQLDVRGPDAASSRRQVRLPPTAGELRARLFAQGVVLDEVLTEHGGWVIDVDMPNEAFQMLCHGAGLTLSSDQSTCG